MSYILNFLNLVVSKLYTRNDRGVSGHQDDSKDPNEHRSGNASVTINRG
jgi:hypothetical protein